MSIRLHYIFDPLCGWCYAAAPLVRAAAALPGVEIVFHPGILFDPPKALAADWRSHILQADARIAQLAGVTFGEAYRARLQSAAPIVLHSVPPAIAVLAAPAAQRLAMLEAIQQAHYVEGRDACAMAQLEQLAAGLQRSPADFAAACTASAAQLPQQRDTARRLLQQVGGQGFPTFVLEIGEHAERIDHARFYGAPDAFVQHIQQLSEGASR